MNRPKRCLLPNRIKVDLYKQCQARLPYESCGVVLGSSHNEELTVTDYRLLRNVSPEPGNSFRFDPAEWLALFIQMQKNQREIVGLWHSHPSGPALPSAQDAEGWDGCGTYWVVGLEGGRPDIAVYTRSGEQWLPLPLVIV